MALQWLISRESNRGTFCQFARTFEKRPTIHEYQRVLCLDAICYEHAARALRLGIFTAASLAAVPLVRRACIQHRAPAAAVWVALAVRFLL
jgi:hypothetical protein